MSLWSKKHVSPGVSAGTDGGAPQHPQPHATVSASEKQLRRAISAAGTGIWEWDVLTDRLEWSDRCKLIFGLPLEARELTLADFIAAIHPQDRVAVEAGFRAALQDRIEYVAVHRILHPDGSERWLAARGLGEYAADGQPLRMSGTANDITERKRAQLALQRSEERFRSLVEATSQIVWASDPQGNLTEISPAFLRYTGIDPTDALGESWLSVVHPDERERTIARWTHSLKTGDPYEIEFLIRMDGGAYRHFRANAVCLRGADGDVREWIGTATDIHDRKLAETGLHQVNKALELKVVEHKHAEAAAMRLNRVYAVLSGINSLIVRARTQQELFDEACRIAVQHGHFLLAWIGTVSGESLTPQAIHGFNVQDILKKNQPIKMSADSPEGQSSAARALREKRPWVCNDFSTDAVMSPWREQALSAGLRSSALLPLLVGQQVMGCLCLYAAEPGFFDDGEMKLLNALAGDISYALEFIAREQRLDYLAYYDALTRLANRRLFIDRLTQSVQAARQNGEGFAVIMVDIARFKTINDTYGMPAGDQLLKLVARRLTRLAGGSSRVARVGGDRFAVVAHDFRRAADLAAILRDRVWSGLNRPYKLAGQSLRIAVRIGIAMFPDDCDDAESLLQNSEAALKKAKVSGDNFLFYTQQMSSALREKLRLEDQLRRALEEAEFVLYYQPKVDLRDNAICGAEALLRWNSPELGLVSPAQFMPLLEETGMIVEVGRWVLHQAVADQGQWLAAGLRAPRIAVNVSPLQLRQPDFVEEVRTVIGMRNLSAASIELEVTESVLMPDMEKHIAKLHLIKDMGVLIAIDDFGTGYSSLSRLSRLPVSSVKIDRSFIVGMTDSADTMNIVSTIISLARSMNLRVVAEGVDSEEQLKFLRLLRCDEIQGFLFSPAVPAADFARLLSEDRRL